VCVLLTAKDARHSLQVALFHTCSVRTQYRTQFISLALTKHNFHYSNVGVWVCVNVVVVTWVDITWKWWRVWSNGADDG